MCETYNYGRSMFYSIFFYIFATHLFISFTLFSLAFWFSFLNLEKGAGGGSLTTRILKSYNNETTRLDESKMFSLRSTSHHEGITPWLPQWRLS